MAAQPDEQAKRGLVKETLGYKGQDLSDHELDEIVRGVEIKQEESLAKMNTPLKTTEDGSAIKSVIDVEFKDAVKPPELPLPEIIESSEQSECDEAEPPVNEPDSIFVN